MVVKQKVYKTSEGDEGMIKMAWLNKQLGVCPVFDDKEAADQCAIDYYRKFNFYPNVIPVEIIEEYEALPN